MTNLVKYLWTSICKQTSPGPCAVEKWWQVIQNRYSEPQRHYHTEQHIEQMCTLLEEYKHRLVDYTSVFYAVAYHDIIYEPQRQDNEEKSAELFLEYAAESHLISDQVSKVTDWILLTKSHSTSAHTTPDSYGTEDFHYFLDFDMSILGSTPQDYKVYADRIRQEYVHIPDDVYRPSRAKVLTSFLETANIFATRDFRERYEVQARQNVQAEITCLNQHS